MLLFAAGAAAAACAAIAPPSSSDRPAFPQYRAGQDGGVRLDAPFRGVLAQRGRCLGLANGDRFVTMIWPASARLSFDERGLLLRDAHSGAELRLGDWVEITGGPLPAGTRHALGWPVLTEDFAIECARRPPDVEHGWIGVVNPGFRKRQPDQTH